MLAEGKDDSQDYTIDKFNLTGLGGGFTLYFGKGYSYFIPEILVNEVSTSINDISGNSTTGLGVNLYAGHDISPGKSLGLGIMGFMHYSSLKLEFVNPTDPPDLTNFYYGAEISLRFGK